MNIELIRQNLNACEEELSSGDPQTAYILAFQTARVLLNQAGAGFQQTGIDPRQLFVACIKASNALSNLFTHQEPIWDVPATEEKQRRRMQELKELFAQKQAELAVLEQNNQALLEEESALRQEEDRLKTAQAKIRELTALKEQGLEALRQETAAWEQKAKELEEACQASLAEQKRLMAVLDENGELIRNLPDSVGAANVDELIRYAKSSQEARQEDAAQSGQELARILEALERLYTTS